MNFNVFFSPFLIKILFLIGLFGILFLDYWFSKDQFVLEEITPIKDNSSVLQTEDARPKSTQSLVSQSPTLQTPTPITQNLSVNNTSYSIPETLTPLLSKSFRNASIQKKEIPKKAFLFETIPLVFTDFSILSTEIEYFIEKNKDDENSNAASVIYPIIRIAEFSSSLSDSERLNDEQLYELIKEKSISFIQNDPESRVVEIQDYGKKSFVIRLESQQKFMYLVIASEKGVYAVSYSLGENFSHHKRISPILKQLFRSSSPR